MSKTNRRRAEKRRRPARRTTRARQHTSAEPDLLADVRRALADRHPLSLFTYVSTLLCVTDSGRNHPFARPEDPDLAALTREDLVTTFLDLAAPETSALLAVIAEMAGDDDVLRARIRRELAARPKAEPAWLAQLSETSTYRAMRMHHILGDGDNFMLGARLPGGHELTCLVYIDHNLGTLVKDAFVVPASVADMVGEFGRVTEDPDTPVGRYQPRRRASLGGCGDRTGRDHLPSAGDRVLARVSRIGRMDHPGPARRGNRIPTATMGFGGPCPAHGSVLLLDLWSRARRFRSPRPARVPALV